MKRVVISIPVHEQPAVVEDHLRNIKKFVPNCIVVLHASADSGPDFYNKLKNISTGEFSDFMYVNDTSYHTHSPHDAGCVTGLSTVHASNFKYINSVNQNFDVFAIETSNDMFVRRGVENLFESYPAACGIKRESVESWKAMHVNIASMLNLMGKFVDLKYIEKHATEGTFYPKEVFKRVSDIVIDGMGGFWAGEELILHTLAFNAFPELYDTHYNGSYVFHNPDHSATLFEDIDRVRQGDLLHKYVVKRVPRNVNDACRKYVNKVTQND